MALANGTWCVPQPCLVAQINIEGGTTAANLIASDGPYPDISLVQFMRWNPGGYYNDILPGDVVCVG